jgi:protein-S-isoprenylcysteine O-methyltransferase Ste14
MQVGVILVIFGEALVFESALLLFYTGVIFLIFHIWIIITEEPYLRSTFGESYKKYCKSVPRWLIK